MKYIISIVASLLVGLGFGYLVFHNGASTGPVGGDYNLNKTQFIEGFTAGRTNQFSVSNAGALTTTDDLTADDITAGDTLTAQLFATEAVGSSSSSPAALSSAIAGHFVLATGGTTASASTTAITANSTVLVQRELETPIAGTTCNATLSASSTVTAIDKVTSNGFILNVEAAPLTNPFCFSFLVFN